MISGKLVVAFGAGAALSLVALAATAYQAGQAPQRPPTARPPAGPSEADGPRRFSLDEMAQIIEELETNRARLKALLEQLEESRPEPRHEPTPEQLAERQRMAEEQAKAEQESARIAAELDKLKLEDTRPNPPFEAPDPPPHEGAMIRFPYVVEAPDLIIVEVLEALPGRPITGERLVRPDGTISLDFYGKLPVHGLTPEQIKTNVILHLRRFLTDEVLGLIDADFETGDSSLVPPVESDRVFVEVTAYNSKVYYVEGDVQSPGRLPFTGNETVLDALKFASGLAPTADPDAIELIRPARGSKPTRTYKIDYRAITQKGVPEANLQILPGDRLFVGRRAAAEEPTE